MAAREGTPAVAAAIRGVHPLLPPTGMTALTHKQRASATRTALMCVRSVRRTRVSAGFLLPDSAIHTALTTACFDLLGRWQRSGRR